MDDAAVGATPAVHVYARNGKEIPTSDYQVTVTNNDREGNGNINVAGKPNGHVKDGVAVQNVYGAVSKMYKVTNTAPAATVTVYRAYNPNSGEHFYTTDKAEINHIVSLGWHDENVGWYGTTEELGDAVYRLYNANGGEHHYTTSASEKDMLVAAGWTYEGIAFYAAKSDAEGAVPVYREYNPNAFANNHNFTTSKEEHDYLTSIGWKDEGIAWYSAKSL